MRPITMKGSRSKYNNQRTEICGITFDSKHEAERFAELRLMERAGLISGLRLQVPYELIPHQKDAAGKIVERAVTYVADFVYKTPEGAEIVEDAKGVRTDAYKIKKKLMLQIYGIRIQEV